MLFRQGEVARTENQTRQFAAFAVTDRGTAAVPVGKFVHLDIEGLHDHLDRQIELLTGAMGRTPREIG